MPLFGDFMLDSGAFSFMENPKLKTNWHEYIERYADFVKRNRIKKYFELDIDSVTGYDKVLEFRKELEKLVGWPCIPVWHKSRGLDEFKKMADEYDYVAIGGIVSGEIRKEDYKYFSALIKIAHEKGAKIHGLGFTNLDGLTRYRFDSVDSTAWTTGNRFGFLYRFNGKTMEKVLAPKGSKLADPRATAINNYTEWIKFQRYAETHL